MITDFFDAGHIGVEVPEPVVGRPAHIRGHREILQTRANVAECAALIEPLQGGRRIVCGGFGTHHATAEQQIGCPRGALAQKQVDIGADAVIFPVGEAAAAAVEVVVEALQLVTQIGVEALAKRNLAAETGVGFAI